MSRLKDNSPVGFTCSKIDEVISFISNMGRYLEDEDAIEFYNKYDYKILELLESIRKDNSTLRDWGNEMFNDRHVFENEISDLESKIEDIENERNELLKKVAALELEVETLQYKEQF